MVDNVTQQDVVQLLKKLRNACQRPLYVDVELNHARWSPRNSPNAPKPQRETSDAENSSHASSRMHKSSDVKDEKTRPLDPEKTWEEVSLHVSAFSGDIQDTISLRLRKKPANQNDIFISSFFSFWSMPLKYYQCLTMRNMGRFFE